MCDCDSWRRYDCAPVFNFTASLSENICNYMSSGSWVLVLLNWSIDWFCIGSGGCSVTSVVGWLLQVFGELIVICFVGYHGGIIMADDELG